MAAEAGTIDDFYNQNQTDTAARQAGKLRREQKKARALQSAGKVQAGLGRGTRSLGKGMSNMGSVLNQSKLGAVAGMPLKAAGSVTQGAGRVLEKAGRVTSRYGRAREKKNQAKQIADKVTDIASAPINQGSKIALRWAWLSLIPSWGLSLIYINIHVFLRIIFPKFFCKPGKEWLPEKIQKAGGEATSVVTKNAGYLEYGLLFGLNLLLLLAILGISAIIIFIISDEVSLLDKAKILLGL